MKFSALQPFLLEGMTIRIPASSPAVPPLKQSVPGLSQPGSCSLSSTHAATSTSASSTSNSLEGYMHGQPLPITPLGLGPCDLQSKKAHQVRSSFLSICPFMFSFQSRTLRSACVLCWVSSYLPIACCSLALSAVAPTGATGLRSVGSRGVDLSISSVRRSMTSC